MASNLVLVTGASGFLGSHVVEQLLQVGYRVRAVSRSAKLDGVKATYASYGQAFEVVAIDDIVAGDFTKALEGVVAVVHVASPVIGRGDTHTVLSGAIQGTRNVIEQALIHGIRKFVVTSSELAMVHPTKRKTAPEVYTADDWNDATEEEAIAVNNPIFTYAVSKGAAERVVWELADQYKDADFTTLLFPFLFGKLVSDFAVAPGNVSGLSSNGLVYGFLSGSDAPLGFKTVDTIDVRDAARAHVLALSAPPSSQVGRKRLLYRSGRFSWEEAAAHLRTARPAIAHRLPQFDKAVELLPRQAEWDIQHGKELLGISELKKWQEYLEEAVDSLLALEEQWKATGWKPAA